jgi:DNA-binding transcriptional MerR regulator
MKTYEAREVLEHTGVTRNRLIRWTDAGIIRPAEAAGGKGTRRPYTFRNEVQVAVCDELRGLGVGEPGMRKVVDALDAHWNRPDAPINWRDPDGPKNRDAAILWVAFQRYVDPDMEVIAAYPVTPENLISRLTDGAVDGSSIAESGIAIPIGRIIADLETKTGDTLA